MINQDKKYFYRCGHCAKTWTAGNFFDVALCPYCKIKSKVYNTKKCGNNQSCVYLQG